MDDQRTERPGRRSMIGHKYQLVFQLPEECPLESLDIEDDIADALRNSPDKEAHPHFLDGNALGGGTIEFFIFTDNPRLTFETCKPLLESAGLLTMLIAAHRRWIEDDYDEFVVIWPDGYTGNLRV